MTERFKDFVINLQHVILRTSVKPAKITIELSELDWMEFIKKTSPDDLVILPSGDCMYYGFTVRRAAASD